MSTVVLSPSTSVQTYFVGPNNGFQLDAGTGNGIEGVQLYGASTIVAVSLLVAPSGGGQPYWTSFGDTSAPALGSFSLGGSNPAITSINGTYASALTSLTFGFSDGTAQTFGTPADVNDFQYDIPNGATFAGFCGSTDSTGNIIVAVGLALNPATPAETAAGPYISMGPVGAPGGSQFVDLPLPVGATVQSVQVYTSSLTEGPSSQTIISGIGLTVVANGNTVPLAVHGNATGTLTTIPLADGEFITSIYGMYGASYVEYVLITTNLHTHACGGPAGPGAGSFNFQLPSGATDIAIVGLAGCSDGTGLTSLGCIGVETDVAPQASSPVYVYEDSGANAYCYSTSQAAPSSSYTSQGVGFHAFSLQVVGTVPVYAYLQSSTGEYFYSLSNNAAPGSGWTLQPGTAFFVYDITVGPPQGTVALSLYVNSSSQYQCGTTAPDGYQVVATLGNVFRPLMKIVEYTNSSGLHYYAQAGATVPAGFTADSSPGFYAFGDGVFGTVPVYCFFQSQTGAYGYGIFEQQLSSQGGSWTVQGVAWYAMPEPIPAAGSTALLQYTNATTSDMILSVSAQSVSGYSALPTVMLAYASPANFAGIINPEAIIIPTGDSLYSTYLTSDAVTAMKFAVAPALPDIGDAASFTATPHWWGITLTLNSAAVAEVADGVAVGATIATALGSLGFAVAPLGFIAGVIAAGLWLEKEILTWADNGNGVYVFYTWPQLAALIVAPQVGYVVLIPTIWRA